MWIRTQDKKRLVDIVDIMIIKVDDHFELCGYPINDCDCRIVLGEYDSEEIALKVLTGIQENIGDAYACGMPNYEDVERWK